MAFKIHQTNDDYESWTVKEFLEHELAGVREIHETAPDPFWRNVIEYLEKRLSGEIK